MPPPEFESPYFAAIDLGSNSFHMLVARMQGDILETIDREKEMVQIARGIETDGSINPETQERALSCLHKFSERLRDIPDSQVRAVGTKTLRSSRNSSSFIKKAEKVLGSNIQIISGFEEARLVYAGLAHTVSNDHSKRLVIDIGGGSTEFVIGQDYSPILLESLNFGCVSYTKQFMQSGINHENMHNAYLNACEELESIRKNYLHEKWQLAYGTSGTMKAIAELTREFDGGATITRETLRHLAQNVIKVGITSTNLQSLRKDVLPAGIAILQAIFDELKLDKIHVADATLKEGLIYDTIGRFSDKDIRAVTVNNLKKNYNIDEHQAKRVSKTAVYFWKQIDSPALPGVSRTKILKWAAQLHEIGLSISHAGYQRHGYYILRHADLAGFGRYEQYILANLVHAHRKKIDRYLIDELDEQAQHAFIPLLVCIRLATCLHRNREDIQDLPRLKQTGLEFTLTFTSKFLQSNPLTHAGLNNEVSYLSSIGCKLKIHS